jgi:hypothetical protein
MNVLSGIDMPNKLSHEFTTAVSTPKSEGIPSVVCTEYVIA